MTGQNSERVRLNSREKLFNVMLSVAIGLGAATILSLVAVLSVVANGERILRQSGHTLAQVVGVYYAVAAIGGVIVGVLLPLIARSSLSAGLVGAVLGIGVYAGLAFPTEPLASWIDGLPWYAGLGIVGGSLVGVMIRRSLGGLATAIRRARGGGLPPDG